MTREISEADWRRIRKLEPVALDRFCRRILAEVYALSGARDRSPHGRFLEVRERVVDGHAEVGAIFCDLRRSNAVQRLARMRARGLVTDAEFAGFSEAARESASLIAEALSPASRRVGPAPGT